MTNTHGNAEFKSDVFSLLLADKKRALEVYNAMNGSAYDDPEIELVCQVYNINKGNNEALLSQCPTLRDYMYFVDLVREYHAKNNFTDLKDAIRQAIEQCIRENILRNFLIEHRQEVEKMMQLDYTFERQIELERQAGEEIGWKLGEEAGRKSGEEEKLREQIRKKLRKAKTLAQIAEDLEEKPDKILPLYEQIREELAASPSNNAE